MTFGDVLRERDLPALRASLDHVTASQVAAAIERERPTFSDFLALLSPVAAGQLEPMARRARQITLQRFGRVVVLYAPIYLSNLCTNECAYCGFAHHRAANRIALGDAAAIAESEWLRALGFQHILLVTGEAPAEYGPERVANILRFLKPRFASLSLEIQPLSTDQYAELAQAGADGVTLYQETYDRVAYAKFHLAGRKRDFDWRLEAIERAGAGGMRRLGIGALLGLSDWRTEAIALGLHAEYLMKHFWRAQVAVSFPRIANAPDGFAVPEPMTDAQLVQMMLALRVYHHDTAMVLSTRENARLRDQLMPLGITQMSAGSRTNPGGYAQASGAEEQFAVQDSRTPAQVAAAIIKAGYEPVWKDWDRELHDEVVI